MKVTKEQAKKLWCPATMGYGKETYCGADQCMLWVELGDGLGCCGYSQEAAWALFSREEKPCDEDR